MPVSAKGFLEDARSLEAQIEHVQWRIARLDSMLDASGYDPARERVGGTRGGDRLAESLDDLAGYRDELAGLIGDYIALQRFAEGVVDRLEDPRYQQVLRLRFFEGMAWPRAAAAMGYSERRAFQLHGEALAELDAVLAEARGEQPPPAPPNTPF